MRIRVQEERYCVSAPRRRKGHDSELASRRDGRAQSFLPVVVRTPQRELHGEIIDISLAGALIRVHDISHLGKRVQLAIEIPRYGSSITAVVEILRLIVYPRKDSGTQSYGLGVRFAELSDEDRTVLEKYCTEGYARS
jgi:c-di-GMP-binding flagellar brake protein YcgR